MAADTDAMAEWDDNSVHAREPDDDARDCRCLHDGPDGLSADDDVPGCRCPPDGPDGLSGDDDAPGCRCLPDGPADLSTDDGVPGCHCLPDAGRNYSDDRMGGFAGLSTDVSYCYRCRGCRCDRVLQPQERRGLRKGATCLQFVIFFSLFSFLLYFLDNTFAKRFKGAPRSVTPLWHIGR